MKRRLEELKDLALLTREEAIELIMLEWPCGRSFAEDFLDMHLAEASADEIRHSRFIH